MLIDFQRLFHTGIRVTDLDKAMDEFGPSLGVAWAQPREGEQPVWTPETGLRSVPLRFTYSDEGPQHLELLEGAPGSIWDADGTPGVHHVGVWVDDVVAETEGLLRAGWHPRGRAAGARLGARPLHVRRAAERLDRGAGRRCDRAVVPSLVERPELMSKGGTVDDVDVMPARLEAFLAEAEPDATDISVLNYEPMIGGYSRVMARFDLSLRREGKEERRQLVFRADPPPDRAGFQTDRRTEWDVLAHLSAGATVSVPAPYWYCDGRHLGSPAILMDFIPSTTLLSHLSGADDLGCRRGTARGGRGGHPHRRHRLPARRRSSTRATATRTSPDGSPTGRPPSEPILSPTRSFATSARGSVPTGRHPFRSPSSTATSKAPTWS